MFGVSLSDRLTGAVIIGVIFMFVSGIQLVWGVVMDPSPTESARSACGEFRSIMAGSDKGLPTNAEAKRVYDKAGHAPKEVRDDAMRLYNTSSSSYDREEFLPSNVHYMDRACTDLGF